MIFYEIELLSLPKLRFSQSVEIKNYENSFSDLEDYLEISLEEQGNIEISFADGRTARALPGMILLILSDTVCRTYTSSPLPQKHTTIGVNIKYRFCRYDDSEISEDKKSEILRNSTENGVFLLPYLEYAGDNFELYRSLIRKAGSHENAHEFLTEWFALLSAITKDTASRLEKHEKNISPAAQRYASRAKQMIRERVCTGFRVPELAKELGISAGYLHGLFKDVCGKSIVDFANECRVDIVKNLTENEHMTLAEASLFVGITDSGYMGRLYKKYLGVGFSERKAQKTYKI